ncbi:MAG: zinc-dependent peptidase [Myxococcota bacterium]
MQLVVALVGAIIVGAFALHRPRSVPRVAPRSRAPIFPHAWELVVQQCVPQFVHWPEPEQARMREVVLLLLDGCVHGARGATFQDEAFLKLAILAAVPLRNFDNRTILQLPKLVLTPTTARPVRGYRDGEPQVSVDNAILIPFDRMLRGIGREGDNIVAHNIAEALDRASGKVDGVPPLTNSHLAALWRHIVTPERVEAFVRGYPSAYVPNHQRAFAVATEHFFDRGPAMRDALPEVYHFLASYFGSQPA